MKQLLLSFSLLALLSHGQDADMSPSQDAISLFDGETLTGWKTSKFDQKFWNVIDGTIAGGDLQNDVPKNVWLVSEKNYENFELTFSIKFTDGGGTGKLKNSGIQVRSLVIPKGVCGYQIDAGPSLDEKPVNNGLGYWGNIWDEHRRRALVTAENQDLLKESVQTWDWNTYKIICNGTNIKTWINGILAHDYTEKNPKIAADGIIALQAHSGGKFLVHFKDLMIKELPATEGSPKWTDEGIIKTPEKKKAKKK